MSRKEDFAARMKRAREDSGYLQSEVGELLGIPQSTYSAWENADRDMPAYIVGDVADLLGTTPDFLLGFTNSMHPRLRDREVNGADLHRYLQKLHQRIRQQQDVINRMNETAEV